MKRLIPLLLVCSGICFGQYSSASASITLNAATQAMTVQQIPGITAQVLWQNVYVACAGTSIVSFTIEQNGTQATGTANPSTAISPKTPTPQAVWFNPSNSTSTNIVGSYNVSSNGYIVVDLSKITWPATTNGGILNMTVRLGSASDLLTTTCSVNFNWQEKQ